MIKGFIKVGLNKILSPFELKIIRKREIFVSASALRERLFRQLARKGFYPAHILDVGANKAKWSNDALKFFPDSKYTLLEPQIEMKPYLDKFCSNAKNAQWILTGAGAAEGELLFTVSSEPASSSFAIPEEWGIERRVLPVTTLDLVCEKYSLSIPDVVKIDAEGLDLDVLRGAQTFFGVTEIFFVELPFFDFWPYQSFHLITQYLREHGYEPYDITDLNRRTNDEALALMEMAFVKRDGMFRDYHGW